MPRFVRPFWISAEAEGYRNIFSFGPRKKDGGFSMSIKQRDNGGISGQILKIDGMVTSDNRIILTVSDGDKIVYKKETVL